MFTRIRVILTAIAVVAAVGAFERPALAVDPPCGSIVTESFTLQNDVSCTNTFWIAITEDKVVVDLNGKTVSNTTSDSVGIFVQGAGATVRNGTIKDFDIGVDVEGDNANKDVVEGLHLLSNDVVGLQSSSSTGTLVKGNVAEGNGIGFNLWGAGITAVANVAKANVDDGFFSITGSSVKADGNTAISNGGDGFQVDSPKALYSHNIALNNAFHGFHITAPTKVLANVANHNGFSGFRVVNSDGAATVTDNVALNNAVNGLVVELAPAKGKGNIAARNGTDCDPIGLCTHAADAALPTFHPTCGVAVTQSFRLDADLTCPVNTNGIVTGADGITIDLNGFRVTGSRTTGFPIGVFIGNSGVTIRHGEVSGFWEGVGVAGTKTLVEGVVVASSIASGMDFGGSGTTVRGTEALLTTGTIQPGTGVGYDVRASKTKVVQNTALTNRGVSDADGGFLIEPGGAGSTLDTNFAGVAPSDTFGNDVGFLVQSTVTMLRNAAIGSNSDGFLLGEGKYKLTANYAYDSAASGFNIATTAAPTLTSNAAVLNDALGFALNSTPAPKAKGNIAALNAGGNCSAQMSC